MVPCDFSASSCFPMVQQRRTGQSLCHGALASSTSSVHPASLSATSPPLCRRSAMAPRHGALASNKPHSAEKSTPVRLAIWRIWAGFANSQHRNAAFATPDNICAHSSLLQTLSSCSDIANLSAHLHRLPTPPPYLRQIRLLPGQMRRSCKSPRARIPVLGTSGAHWPARWPRFELTEHAFKS